MINQRRALEDRIASVRARIAATAFASGRASSDVTLVAVTKSVDRDTVDTAYDAGLRSFGENRVPDARAKFARPLPADARLHLIGQLQTNKAGHAVDLFDLIESVDRPSLIAELERQGARRERAIPILLQVNVAREEQKAGCSVEDVDSLVASILEATHLDLHGLMTIAPLVGDVETTRPVFAGLRALRDRLKADHPGLALPILSMGMSNDFEIAVQEGATHVRVGRAIFG